MCLLIYASPNNNPSKKALRRAAKNNPDGFGFAVRTNSEVLYFKSMSIEDTIKEFFDLRKRFPDSHSIFHLRITTHGATNLDNCHPFVVDDAIVLAHNGMLPIKEQDGKSDTRQFAEEWLPMMGVKEMLDTPQGFADLENFASGSKLAIVSANPNLDHPFYIVNERLGHWDNGVWYSNSSYTKNYNSWASYSSASWRSYNGHAYTPQDDASTVRVDGWEKDPFWQYDEEMEEWYYDGDSDDEYVRWQCNICQLSSTYNLETDEPHACPDCGTCWFCERDGSSCYCWLPATGRK